MNACSTVAQISDLRGQVGDSRDVERRMTLELNKVTKQVTQLGEQAAQRKHELDAITPQVRQILHDHARDDELRQLALKAMETQRWRGAVPIGEPLDAAIDPPPHPTRLTVVASDGSQIYPDIHGIALYYLINIGTIVFKCGSGQAPIVSTDPQVYGDAEDLYDDDQLVSGPLINARRSLSELSHITQLSLAETQHGSTLALMDGTLALWARAETISKDQQDQLERDYIRALDQLREALVPIGAFVSRPRSTMVAQLVRLAELNETIGDANQAISLATTEKQVYGGLRDTRFLADLLKAGQRSAVFEVAPGWNTTYRERGHSIHFLYVNVGDAARSIIARVEVPVWIAHDRSAIGLLHAAIVEQCRVSIGYPYVLARAHEIAVVTNAERAEFEKMIATQLTRSGVEARPSEKAFQKSLLAGRRR